MNSPPDSMKARVRTMLRSALAISILLVAGLRTDASSRLLPSANLLGTWKLKAVGGKDPATIAIKSWQVEFREQGNWIYSGSMTGKWEGMKLSGSGTWPLQGNHLESTAGVNTGKATVHIDNDSLVLSPDPVVRLNGKEAVETQYVRLVSP